MVPADSRAIIAPTTLQVASGFEPLALDSRCAAIVSAVSADCARLLVSCLEHEVLEAAFFCLDGVQRHALHLPLNRRAVEVCKLDSGGSNHRQIAVSKKKEVTSVMENCGNIRGNKVFILPES